MGDEEPTTTEALVVASDVSGNTQSPCLIVQPPVSRIKYELLGGLPPDDTVIVSFFIGIWVMHAVAVLD